MSERLQLVEVPREKIHHLGGNIEFVTPEGFHLEEILTKIYPHTGKNGVEHKGNMKVMKITGEAGSTAEAACVQRDCGVWVEVTAKVK